MKKIHLKPAFSDNRGDITDIIDHTEIEAVTIITFNPGVVRGNHYHKETVQWNYLISGKVLYRSKSYNGKTTSTILNPGDLIISKAKEIHAMKGLKKSLLLVLTRGPRGGKEYESDTFRDKKTLINSDSIKKSRDK